MARRDAVSQDVLQADATTNLALWLDRYAWSLDQEVFRQHHDIALERIRVPEGYRRAAEQRELVLANLRGDYPDAETWLFDITFTGRAIIGIGMASVRETNLSLLRPWGVPFIPGSALKGLASHVAHGEGEQWRRPAKPGEKAGVYQRALFGDVTSGGAVVFHDAWWKPGGDRIPIDTDTMTVHHSEYYQGKAAPADWDEPAPVSFLTMRGTYVAAITGPAEALAVAESLLQRGLKERGVGAKTAAGYGRAELRRHLSDVMRQLQNFNPGVAAANTVQQHAQSFLRLVEQARTPEEQRSAAQVAVTMVNASPATWKKWLENPARTPEERQWFSVEQEDRATTPATPSKPSASEEIRIELRRVRVKYIPDKKAASRYFLRIEGESKDVKGHLISLPAHDLERIKAGGTEGAVVELEYVNGRPRAK